MAIIKSNACDHHTLKEGVCFEPPALKKGVFVTLCAPIVIKN